MARATTKTELLKNANDQFEKMWNLINSLTKEQQNIDFHFDEAFLEKQKESHWKRDKNIRDILVHLYEWHNLLLNWITSNQNGEEKPFLPEPYNWKTYPQMNVGFWENHQQTTYENAINLLKKSHESVIKLIDTFSSDELFTKKHFSWTGTTSLGSYCVSATSSHYEWAIKKVKQHIKTMSI